MALSYRKTGSLSTQFTLGEISGVVEELGNWFKKSVGVLIACLFVGAMTGCVNTVDEAEEGDESATISTMPQAAEPEVIVAAPSSSSPIEPIDDLVGPPDTMLSSPTPQFDESGIAVGDIDLERLLTTQYVLENQQFVPTTGWICADTIGQNRIYYFYQVGVLDTIRNVAIERTLNANDTHSDITFFWSVVATDAIIMTSVNRDDNGVLISSGRQYDVNSIRFNEVESVQTFTAESVLRGRLVCGNYDLR